MCFTYKKLSVICKPQSSLQYAEDSLLARTHRINTYRLRKIQ